MKDKISKHKDKYNERKANSDRQQVEERSNAFDPISFDEVEYPDLQQRREDDIISFDAVAPRIGIIETKIKLVRRNSPSIKRTLAYMEATIANWKAMHTLSPENVASIPNFDKTLDEMIQTQKEEDDESRVHSPLIGLTGSINKLQINKSNADSTQNKMKIVSIGKSIYAFT